MSNPGKKADIFLDLTRTYQRIDGFGVNINARYWVDQKLLPAMDLLLDELGATLYRVDIWGKSNWIDPDGEIGPAALAEPHLATIYQSDVFQHAWALMHYLNECGIEPYLTCSGDVPVWMLAEDGKTLQDYESFTEMLVSLIEWACRTENIHFSLFGPLNETDLGSPEGPLLSPEEYVKVCELLDAKLNQRGLDEIRLVAPEQACVEPGFIQALVQSQRLHRRLGVFSLHNYTDLHEDAYLSVTSAVRNSSYQGRHLWISEFGDLDQTGEREWYVAWTLASRLMDHLAAGFNASLAWDAFDNFHEHDQSWTIYGLLRFGLRTFTPKKRFYALKQVFRFVLPGFERVEAVSDNPDLRVLAFADPERSEMTIVGMNLSAARTYYLNIDSPTIPESLRAAKVDYYRTSEQENCALVEHVAVRGTNEPFCGISVQVPPDSIFTLTTV
jgi:hypothetical protein